MRVGDKSFIKKTFTSEDVETFAALSGDLNPVHLNEQYASESIFGERIVHGALTASLISAVLGTKLPGPGAIYISQDVRFVRPVFLNDEITAEVEVTEMKSEKSIAIFRTSCYNQALEVVLEGKAVLKYK
jgi:3-hydroxybutyryl-CoA dehydratase